MGFLEDTIRLSSIGERKLGPYPRWESWRNPRMIKLVPVPEWAEANHRVSLFSNYILCALFGI